jgi:hypothetical protein
MAVDARFRIDRLSGSQLRQEWPDQVRDERDADSHRDSDGGDQSNPSARRLIRHQRELGEWGHVEKEKTGQR